MKDIVEEAQQTRAPIVRLTEEYARYYMPLILLIAGFVLFFTKDVQRAISVIVVSIPCTFVLAGPSAMVAALAAASRMGILVKSVRFFEAANDIDTVVFDKTGTLTTGELRVAAITPNENGRKRIARDHCRRGTTFHSSNRARGCDRGARSTIGDRRCGRRSGKTRTRFTRASWPAGCRGGSGAWFKSKAIAFHRMRRNFDDLSALHVGVNRKLAGIIYLSDTVRAEAKNVTENLREEGVDHFMMLTGDRRTVAESIAGTCRHDGFRGRLFAGAEAGSGAQLKTGGRKVMVVGDGVNDAPALAAGDLSVAMGALGSDVAIQTADIAFMANDLSRVSHFLALSDKTLRIINQNMFCGLAFIGAAIVLSGVGLIPPIAAAFIHEFGAFFVIFNSARLLRFEGKPHELAAVPYESNRTSLGFLLAA